MPFLMQKKKSRLTCVCVCFFAPLSILFPHRDKLRGQNTPKGLQARVVFVCGERVKRCCAVEERTGVGMWGVGCVCGCGSKTNWKENEGRTNKKGGGEGKGKACVCFFLRRVSNECKNREKDKPSGIMPQCYCETNVGLFFFERFCFIFLSYILGKREFFIERDCF